MWRDAIKNMERISKNLKEATPFLRNLVDVARESDYTPEDWEKYIDSLPAPTHEPVMLSMAPWETNVRHTKTSKWRNRR